MKPKSKKMANGNKPPKPPHSGGKPDEPYVPPTWIPKPTGLIANAISPTEVELSWNAVAPVNPAYPVFYWIYRGDYVPSIIPETTFIDGRIAASPLSPNTTYIYSIAAVLHDANGVSTLGPKSDPVTVITPTE